MQVLELIPLPNPPLAAFLDQAKSLANQAVSTASQTINTIAAHPTVQQASNTISSAATTAAEKAGPVLRDAAVTTGQAAQKGLKQAQQAAHSLAPGVIPAASAGGNVLGGSGSSIDRSHDLKPSHPTSGTSTLENHLSNRPDAGELQDKHILLGQPGDGLAGKKAELETQMKKDKLEGFLEGRDGPDGLVKKGILNGEFRECVWAWGRPVHKSCER